MSGIVSFDGLEADRVLGYARALALKGSIQVQGKAIMVTHPPDTREICDEHERVWKIIFANIYDGMILGARCCMFRCAVSASEVRDVEAHGVDFIFADTTALRSGFITPCVSGDEYKRLFKLGVVFCPVQEAGDLGIGRIYVRAAHFLKIVF